MFISLEFHKFRRQGHLQSSNNANRINIEEKILLIILS